MRAGLARLGGVGLVLGAVAFLLLTPFPEDWHATWSSKFFDLGHVPLFATVTVCLWWLLGRSLLWASAIALFLAGLGEVLQYEMAWGRSGDVPDFIRGALGVGAAGVLLHAWKGPWTAGRLALHALAVITLVAWPVLDAFPSLLDAYAAYRAFPTLASFSSSWELERWECQQAELTRVADPNGWAGRLELRPGPAKYPGAELETVVRDWTGYRRVCCAFAVEGAPLRVVFSLRGRGEPGRSTHFQTEQVYEPGTHTFCLDLAAAAAAARPVSLDLRHMHTFHVFTYRPERPRVLRLFRVWLE
jgi:hypothetical protein